MSCTDPIADMLTRIRNASAARHESVVMPHSRLKAELARVLKREGYLLDYAAEAAGGRRALRLYLKYGPDHAPVISGLRRASRPGLRRYAGAVGLPRVLNGLGLSILTTSSGILTDREARRRKVGGEILCEVW